MKLLQSDLSSMLESELELKLKELKMLLFSLRSEHKFTKRVQKPHRISDTRKSIARVLTEIKKRKLSS